MLQKLFFYRNILKNLPEWLFCLGQTLLLLGALTTVFSSLSLHFGLFLNQWQLILAGLISFSTLFFAKNKLALPSKIFAGACLVLIIVGSLGISTSTFDLSYDGQSYQQEAVFFMKENWNPYQTQLTKTQSPYNHIWLNSYPKAAWLNAVASYNLTGNIESGKMWQLIWMISAFCLTLSWCLKVKIVGFSESVFLSLITAFNPVSLNQVFTFYQDGQLVSQLVILIALLGDFYLKPTFWKSFLLVSITALVINAKMVGVVYFGLFIAAFWAVCYFLKSTQIILRSVIPVLIGLLLGVIVIGYNPFLTNLQNGHHVLYPVLGIGSVDLKSENVPLNYTDKNSWQILAESIFFASSSDRNLDGKIGSTAAKFKIPLSVSLTELKAFWNMPDKGGFGVFFSGILVLLCLLLVYSRDQNPKLSTFINILKGYGPIIFVVIFSSGLNFAPSVARYVPQFWFLVPIFLLLLYQNQVLCPKKFTQIGLVLLQIIIVANLGIIASSSTYFNLKTSQKLDESLKNLSKISQTRSVLVDFQQMPANKIRFDDFGIRYTQIGTVVSKPLICGPNQLFVLPNSVAIVCLR